MEEQTLFFENKEQWEAWLKEHHRQEAGIRLLVYKKHTKRVCISYEEALEVALCYGWIDGLVNRIDETQHTIRFSPRRKRSIWSTKNKNSILKLMDEGKVQPLGLEKVEEAKANGRWDDALIDENAIPQLLIEALKKYPKAKAFYESLPNSAKKQYHWWILEAKQDQTKEKRVDLSIKKLSKHLRVWEEDQEE